MVCTSTGATSSAPATTAATAGRTPGRRPASAPASMRRPTSRLLSPSATGSIRLLASPPMVRAYLGRLYYLYYLGSMYADHRKQKKK
jgi:hypothetical protein